jgi:hypothetical protein
LINAAVTFLKQAAFSSGSDGGIVNIGDNVGIKILQKGDGMMRKFVLWVCSIAVVAFGAEIYVSPSGSDGGNGSQASPLATLAAARDKADQLKSNGPVTVYLRGGAYYLTEPLVFGPSNSGTATAPIIYTAYGTEKPVISGAIKLKNQTWTVSSGSIMKTTIATNLKVDQLFLNSKRQILARYPNYNESQKLQGSAADALTKAASCAKPEEGPGYFRAMHPDLWGSNDFIITGKSGGTVNYTWVGDNQRSNSIHAQYRMIENIYELLDSPGEWFYRKSTGELFFWPPSGADPNKDTIELASLDELIHIAGTSMAAKVSCITFKGLTFTQTCRTMFNTSIKYEPLLMGDWCIQRAGTVFIQNAENIRVESCNFEQVGGNALFMSGYNRKHVIFNNKFTDGGASCVAICGVPSAVRCACTWSSSVNCTDKTPGPLTDEYPAYILVDNNTMYNFGVFEKQVAGVELSMTMCDTIRHNTIYHCPRAGININDGTWGGHLIEYNKVYEVVLETSDHGPFNSWGRARNWGCGDGKWGYVPDLATSLLDPIRPTVLRNNYFKNKDTSFFGIDLDDGSTNYYCYNNLCIGGGFKLQRGRFNHCVNNIIVGGGTFDIHDPMPQSGDSVKHNIVVGYEFGGKCCGWTSLSADGAGLSSGVLSRVAVFDSNCYWGYGKSPRVYAWSGGSDRSGTSCTWDQWLQGGCDAHSKLADPLFVDPAKEDYRVKEGSPALALGFKNFPMDSFGVQVIPTVISGGRLKNSSHFAGNGAIQIHYNNKRLLVSHSGSYSLTVLTASGKIVGSFSAKGDASFDLDRGAGLYLVNLVTKDGVATRRFVVY